MLKKIYLGLFIISSFAFSEDIDDLYNSGLVKYKGIDVLNFYIPVEEKTDFIPLLIMKLKMIKIFINGKWLKDILK